MVLGEKKVAIFHWEWGGNSAPGDGQKRPCAVIQTFHLRMHPGPQIRVRKRKLHP